MACALAFLCLGAQSSAATRATPDGSLDGDGSLVTDLPIAVTDATLDLEGRIVVGGIRYGQPSVARFLPDGSPDPSFGADGDGEVHEGSVNGTLDVEVEVQADGSIRVLVQVEEGASRNLRVDLAPSGAQTGAVRFADSAGSADLMVNGGAVATFVDNDIVTRRYGFFGAEDPDFQPEAEPATRCETGGIRCRFFAPTEVAVNYKGTVVRSVKSLNSFSSCDGTETVTSLAPFAVEFGEIHTYAGCGISEVFSIETDPRSRFLVTGWGGPPSKAEFVRYTRAGQVDTKFGDNGVALGPELDTDNLFLPDPAFANRGAFYTSFTHPRTPTLDLKPVRFNALGQFAERFDSRSQKVGFDAADGITDFDPAVTLRTNDSRILIIGTGETDAGPAPAIARWRAR